MRALYLYIGMTDVAMRTGDKSLLDACRTLFDSVANKRMYLTGGCGSTRIGEAFTVDYDLPNETAYAGKRPVSYMSASKSSRVPGELEKLCGKRRPIGRQQGFGLICRS